MLPVVGAVSTLEGPTSSGAEPINIQEFLRGRVPGLIISGASLRLRGATQSMRSTPPPLVVIDGMSIAHEVASQVLNTLRPQDVERVDVLRDVASTSVYGMRGAGGVILIRTRK
jgi:TonB-dependent SusC/RagA subfamily outer membrane receptor